MRSLLFLFGAVTAHVRLRFEDRPIRNAPSASSDGSYSVSGPCGGNAAWGANGFSEINDGDTISVKISYNGGHQSNNNRFEMRYVCATEGTNIPQSTVSNANGIAGCATVPATEGRIDPPYEVTCTLPTQSNTNVEDCTISVLDQRGWGGCLDVKLQTSAATPPSSSINPPPVSTVEYRVREFDPPRRNDADQKCRVLSSGSIDIDKDSNPSVVSIAGKLCGSGVCADVSLGLTQGASTDPFVSTMEIEGENFEFSFINDVLTATNIGGGNPTVCDAILVKSSECDNLDCYTSRCACDVAKISVEAAIGLSFMGIFVLLILVVIYVLFGVGTLNAGPLTSFVPTIVLLLVRIFAWCVATLSPILLIFGAPGVEVVIFCVLLGVAASLALFITSVYSGASFHPTVAAVVMTENGTHHIAALIGFAVVDTLVAIATGLAATITGSYAPSIGSTVFDIGVLFMYLAFVASAILHVASLLVALHIILGRGGETASQGPKRRGNAGASKFANMEKSKKPAKAAAPPSKPVKPSGSVTMVRALFDYAAQLPDELSFSKDDVIIVLGDKAGDDGWGRGKLGNKTGLYPKNYVATS